jgi:hypothetical protein
MRALFQEIASLSTTITRTLQTYSNTVSKIPGVNRPQIFRWFQKLLRIKTLQVRLGTGTVILYLTISLVTTKTKVCVTAKRTSIVLHQGVCVIS